MPPTPHHILDVRTPAEVTSTGLLTPLALNIPHTAITSLPSILLSTRGLHVQKTDRITLYCRSGRRSQIAAQVLKGEGYVSVRDVGGWEAAGEVLRREEGEEEGGVGVGAEEREKEKEKGGGGKRGGGGFEALVAGLKMLEEEGEKKGVGEEDERALEVRA